MDDSEATMDFLRPQRHPIPRPDERMAVQSFYEGQTSYTIWLDAIGARKIIDAHLRNSAVGQAHIQLTNGSVLVPSKFMLVMPMVLSVWRPPRTDRGAQASDFPDSA
jgi:hypothetical protein